MDYVAIDFETANASLTSACSIGIVAITNDRIVFEKEYLINPQESFSEFNITIHGITSKMVADEKTFLELWPEIRGFFQNTLVFAHNAEFDIAVLKALVEKYQLDTPSIKVGCTLKVAQRIWKGIVPNCKLGTLSKYLEVDHNHHDSLSDALVCTKIIERAKRVKNVSSEEELYEALGLIFGGYNKDKYWGSFTQYHKAKPGEIIDNPDIKNKVVAFGGKPKGLTRKEFSRKLLINGAYLAKGINRGLDYFIIFENCPKTKIEQLNLYKDRGCLIKELDEEQIMRILK